MALDNEDIFCRGHVSKAFGTVGYLFD